MSLEERFGTAKPVIAMVHFPGLPGRPRHDRDAGRNRLVDVVGRDLEVLQDAGVDALLFCNENDIPYQLQVGPEVAASVAAAIAQLRDRIRVPFGVDILWDPKATLAVARATGAVFTNITPEFSRSVSGRPVGDRARSAAYLGVDALLVSGQMAGVSAEMDDLRAAKAAVGELPVLANTGVTHDNVASVLEVADGVIVGTSLKVDGSTWNAVDPRRARHAAELVAAARQRLAVR
jgi:uncharacterized protein